MMENIEREEFDSLKDFKNHIDIKELDDILKKAKSNSIRVKPATTKDFLSEIKEVIEEGDGIRCYTAGTSEMARGYTVYCEVDGVKDETYSNSIGFQVSFIKQ